MSSSLELLARARDGDRVALSRVISMLEAGDENAIEILRAISTSEEPYIVGFVGPPGAGKSTLIASLAPLIASASRNKVAIISIDPSSPLYGGAILGNRLRMLSTLNTNENIYMRSFSSGTMTGGLSKSVFSVVKLLRYCGYGTVLLEGVGAGQLDYKPLIYSHTRIVVITPLSGDLIQMIKAGVMELGDIYVINKADQPGADAMKNLLEESIRTIASIDRKTWIPRVVLTAALRGQGVEELARYIEEHREHLLSTGLFSERSRIMRRTELIELISTYIGETIGNAINEDKHVADLVNSYIEGKSPYNLYPDLVKMIVKSIFSRWC